MKRILFYLSIFFLLFTSCKDIKKEEKDIKKKNEVADFTADTLKDDYSTLKKRLLSLYLKTEKEAFFEYHKNTQEAFTEYFMKIQNALVKLGVVDAYVDWADIILEEYEIEDSHEASMFFLFKESEYKKYKEAERSFYKKYQKIKKDALEEYQNKKILLDEAQKRNTNTGTSHNSWFFFIFKACG